VAETTALEDPFVCLNCGTEANCMFQLNGHPICGDCLVALEDGPDGDDGRDFTPPYEP
jgi:hypothetical protein